MATRIKKMKWNEISGVDAPANTTPGWMLQKSAEFADDIEAFEKAIVSFSDSLGSESVKLYFADAPENVRKALEDVSEYVDAGLEDEEDSEDETPEDEGTITKLRKLFKKDTTETEEETDEESDEDEEDENEDEDVNKDEASDEDSEDDEDESDEDEDEDDEDSDEDDEDEDDVTKAERTALVKDVVDAVNAQLDPIRESIGAIADRTGKLEKHAAGRTSIDGQEAYENDEDEDEQDERAGLHKAITRVARQGGKVTLT